MDRVAIPPRILESLMMLLLQLMKIESISLFAALFLVACLAEAGTTLDAPEAYKQVKAGTITLIDIRTPPGVATNQSRRGGSADRNG